MKEVINEYNVVPLPVTMNEQPGRFYLNSDVPVVVNASQEVKNIASSLSTTVLDVAGIKLKPGGELHENVPTIVFDSIPDMEKEAYKLSVTPQQIKITASTPNGFYYGLQTLYQLLPVAIYSKERARNAEWSVPCVEIEDTPAFRYRGAMLDVCRHFASIDYIKKFIDVLAVHKMNTFHWHLTDDQGWRIEIKKYPKLTEIGSQRSETMVDYFYTHYPFKYDGKPHGGYYTQEEIKEVVEYAAKRHIMVVPEVNMPGHACAAIAAYPWLGTSGKEIKVPTNFGVKYDVFNVADPKVIQFFEDVIDEMIPLFPSPVFHIGGDEVRYNHWNESPYVRSYMTKNGLKAPAELQVYFTNNMSNLLAGKSRRMMGWNEITGDRVHSYQKEESDADAKNIKLAKGTIVHFWKGDTALIRRTIEKGYDVVNSYHNSTYLDYSYEQIPLKKSYFFDPIPEGLTDDQKKRILGLGCQMWGEFIPTVESMNLKIYPRIAAYSEAGWTDKSHKDYNRFLHALEPFLKRWKAKGVKYDVAK